MTEFLSLPQLELGEHASPFDEAVILIDGHEEETIRIECEHAADLAERLIRYVNSHEQIISTLIAAGYALRSYEFGNGSPELARAMATNCEAIAMQAGVAA